MDFCYIQQICFLVILFSTLTFTRSISYNQLDYLSENNGNYFSANSENSQEDRPHLKSRSLKNHHHFVDLLRQAYHQGWRPRVNHYMPATRFGRYRR